MWQSYWLLGVCGGWVYWTIILNLVNFAILPDLLAALLLIGYTLYAAIGIWRSAFNVNWIGWGYIARGVLIVSAFGLFAELIGAF